MQEVFLTSETPLQREGFFFLLPLSQPHLKTVGSISKTIVTFDVESLKIGCRPMLLLEIKNTTTRLSGLDKTQHKLLSDALSYEIEGSAFAMRALPKGAWDGRKRLLQRDGSFPAGLTLEVAKWIKENELKVRIEDFRNKAEITQIPVKMRSGLEPRPFQSEAVKIATTENRPRGIFVIGTGGGKSITAAMLIDAIKTPTLFVTPDKGLKVQTLEVFRHWLGKGVCEKIKGDAPIVVVNVHQIAKCEEKDLERFRMLMIDEFHHCLRSDTRIMDMSRRSRTIEEIYNSFQTSRKTLKVRSWNGSEWVSKAVTNVFRYTAPKTMKRIRVQDEDGTIREIFVTDKHKIYTPNGKVEAGDIRVGDDIFLGYTTHKEARRRRSINPEYRQHLSERASKNNAKRSPESRANQAAKLRSKMEAGEHNPYGRGKYGNGRKLTPTQEQCLEALPSAVAEHAVTIGDGERPYHYKIDVALPEHKIALEIDGSSHKGRADIDYRKDRRLEAIGWSVIRLDEGISKEKLSRLTTYLEMGLSMT